MKLFLLAGLMWDRRCAAAASAFARLCCAWLWLYSRMDPQLPVWGIVLQDKASCSCEEILDQVSCACSRTVSDRVRIPGAVAHIEIEAEVNKWE